MKEYDVSTLHNIKVTVNGMEYERAVEARLLLSDFLRHVLGLSGTHVGCEHGICGACRVVFDGLSMRSGCFDSAYAKADKRTV